MARRPNYNLERRERAKAKADKRAARAQAKKEKADQRKGEPEDAGEPAEGAVQDRNPE